MGSYFVNTNAKVSLRPINPDNFNECISLGVNEDQKGMVASNVYSIAEAYVDRKLYPLAIYDIAAQGWEKPKVPMIGFTMYQIDAEVGFINRLMIDSKYQGKGYGEATMVEIIRRLKLYPGVEIITTSYHPKNVAAAKLYRKLGFVEWNIGWTKDISNETYVILES